MSRYRFPPNKDATKSVPHERDRAKQQPYAKEVEEYSGDVVKPPEQKTGVDGEEKQDPARK